MTRKRETCRWRASAIGAPVLIVLITMRAHAGAAAWPDLAAGEAADATMAPSAATPGLALLLSEADGVADASTRYLEVILNEVRTGRVARFSIQDNRISASAETLRALGLQWPGSDVAQGRIALDELSGLQAHYDTSRQQIRLLVPVTMLAGSTRRVGYSQRLQNVADPLTPGAGLVMNYDIYAQQVGDTRSVSGWSDWRLFGRFGVLGNTMVSRRVDNSGHGTQHENIRLDSTWQLDFPERMLSLTVGDSVTGALAWTRPTRVGGIRLSRNFSLQPYRVVTPLVSFTGESVLPSTVDLLINGIRQSREQVLPGQFQIDTAPTLNGAGQAQVVITDINGRSQVVDFSIYGSQQLLQQGMSDWSLELGAVRQDYGVRSFSYRDEPMFSATGRYGVNEQTTLEGHMEGSDGLVLAGLGAVRLLGQRGGILSAAASGSQYEGAQGFLGRLGYQWNSAHFNTGLTSTYRDADYRDVASLEGGLMARRTHHGYVGVSGVLGYWSASYIHQQYDGSPRSRYVSLNWSKQLPRNAMLSLSASRELERDNGTSAYLYFSLPLDRLTNISASVRHARDTQSLMVGAKRSVPVDLGGWGWRAQATAGDGAGGQAELTYLARYGQWTAGVDHRNGGGDSTAWYGGLNGGVVLMGGHGRLMRRVDDAFAMVSTDGVAGVPVQLENRLVGYTDDKGVLLINRLNAWQRNQLSIDPLGLPADMYVATTRSVVVPASRSGSLVRFNMQRTLAVRLIVRGTDGVPLPAGSEVRVQAQGGSSPVATSATVVGHDGLVYLQDPPAHATLHVRMGKAECVAQLPTLSADTGTVDAGEVVCR
ncbi:fimbria/pilus outer membrane usher protein [Stenotrophomonas sp. SY1]|uniref:fimbria/pilus outer membrane usher protein n=1 Tax=Stenotrophomonas sp. SY1 TaxID=477235 RepID=UPI001E3FF672|nr:fimbria/pilus outer membrane usher protein [Stenotrophomonas sp. SY1]MCD9086989.1 fimbria/pilus outer membrane usher protein [Stenotrophomonas sp. SY1]